MDILLSKVTQQAMNYAIRSGITITSGYAISQCGRLLKTKNGQEREELGILQRRLDSKIRIISPAIEMIELITARGNTSLESAVALTKALRWDIQALGIRLSKAAADEETARRRSSKAKSRAQMDSELKHIISDMKSLLERIEDAVPLINLAITTSGVSLSTALPVSVSPSRLLQASTFLSAGDAQYSSHSSLPTQIGPVFTLSMYMLFSGHALRAYSGNGLNNTTWQEVMHKVKVKLLRTALDEVDILPFSEDMLNSEGPANAHKVHGSPQAIPATAHGDEFAYQLLLVEDLDDDRVHTVEEDQPQPGPFDDVAVAGIREVLPIHQISKIFYADTGKILNIGSDGETNNPVLLLKRDVDASPPRRMMSYEEKEQQWASQMEGDDTGEVSELEAQFARESIYESPGVQNNEITTRVPWRLPLGLDPEWIALEVYNEEPESDSEYETGVDDDDTLPSKASRFSRQTSVEPSITTALSNLHITSTPQNTMSSLSYPSQPLTPLNQSVTPTSRATSLALPITGPIRTSLSLLEMLIRLTSLQQFQQASHLTINDELLNFFLEEASTTGAAPGDVEERKRIRMAARQRVGFDPYDESPIKRRGEDYQHRQDDAYGDRFATPLPARSSRHSTPKRSPQHSTPISISGTKSSTPENTATNFTSDRCKTTSNTTPLGATKSRQAFLKHESSQSERGSPLARGSLASDNDDTT